MSQLHSCMLIAHTGNSTSSTIWIHSLHLHAEHKKILQQKLWLDDTIINAGQTLLKRQFPDAGGLHSTLAVAAKSCEILPAGAIQIMHILSNHWVCIKVSEDKSTIYLYDSKYSSIPSAVVDLILDITRSEKDAITIKSMKMQEQEGCDACGVYSLAVATALCTKQNPSVLRWEQEAMWQHLLQCFEVENLTTFPLDGEASSLPDKNKVVKTTVVHNLYCICRRRYKPKEKMKQCKECNGWFHVDCLKIPNTVMVKGGVWICSACM